MGPKALPAPHEETVFKAALALHSEGSCATCWQVAFRNCTPAGDMSPVVGTMRAL